MTITIMKNSTALSLAEIKDFLKSSDSLQFKSISKNERNSWIQSVIMFHKYLKCKRKDKNILRQYIIKLTGLSKSQLTRLIAEYRKRATIGTKEIKRNTFKKKYTKSDIELLAKVDNAHNRMAGQATIAIMKDEFNLFDKNDFERLKDISVSHLYRLRQTPRYRENHKIFSKTNPTKVPIGERRKPEPNGKPGYLCVDTVHQGDKNKEKGVYHINIVDMVTQFEFIGAVETISEKHMIPILENLISSFPFIIKEFHSDNGSEYINRVVAKLLNKLLIILTKSRPRRSNDNGLIETKNGSVIRKHIGYSHIPKNRASSVNDFYNKVFNEYLNYHRPCAFPKIIIDKKGKEKRIYPKEYYMTPYTKLKSITDINKYLKSNITFEQLDKIAYKVSHTEYAEMMQKEKIKMFKNVLN